MSATSISLTSTAPKSLRRRIADAVRARPALSVALATLLVVWAGLLATHPNPPSLPLARSLAIARVKADPPDVKLVPALRSASARVTVVDRRYEVVSLFEGPRLVLAAVVSASGQVAYRAAPVRSSYAYGSNIANDWRVLLLMSMVFILMSAVWPLRRLRNLDVLIATSSVFAVVLLNAGTIDRMVLASYPVLLYLGLRCAWRAFGPRPAPAPSISLYEKLTERCSPAQRLRLLRMTAGAATLIVAMVGLSSLGVVDVGYAVMEGATQLLHGLLPYGHIPDVLHGDTYPIGSYALFVPFAAISPVRTEWDSADLTLVVAVAAALLAGWGIWRGNRAPGAGSGTELGKSGREESERLAPLRGLIAWLTFPPMLVAISTGTTDVALAAILLGALMLWRRPAISTTVLAAGAWFKLAPAALLPLWLAPLRGRQLVRALAGVVAVSAAMLVPLLALGGVGGVSRMLHAASYQQSRESINSLWAIVGSVPLQQFAEAATIALIAAGMVRLRRDASLAHDRTRVAALGGAVMLGLQISASYWTYLYLAWALPFLALSVLGARDGVDAPGAVPGHG